MFGRKPQVSPLVARKQLLIAESELNRVRLSEDWRMMAHGVHNLTRRTKTIAVWTSAVALLVAGITALRRGPLASGTAKSTWFQKILEGARVVSTVWSAFRARRETEDPQ